MAKKKIDKHKYEYHGEHWNALNFDSEEKIMDAISKSIENGDLIGTKNKTHLIYYTPKDKNGENEAVTIKMIFSEKTDGTELMSAYPCATSGAYVHVKIKKINEWENALEATIEGETEDGNEITFFDTDYILHKDEYKKGKKYWFSLAGIAYFAEVLEKGESDFEFTGQKAIDFKAKIGEMPEFDKNGNVKPVKFCLDNLVAFFQNEIPDDAEFQSPLSGSKRVSKFFGEKLISGYSITIYRNEFSENSNEISIPLVVAQENLKGKTRQNKPCRGVVWVHGHVVSDEEVERFHEFKQKLLDHLDSLLFDTENAKNENIKNAEKWEEIANNPEEKRKQVAFSYETVPFNMIGRFKDFSIWDKELIMACIDFKKKYDKWPTAIIANEATYARWEEAVKAQLGEPDCENETEEDFSIIENDEDEYDECDEFDDEEDDDEWPEMIEPSSDIFSNTRIALSDDEMDDSWDNYDTSIPLEEITAEGIPIEFGDDFATPFFRLVLLVDNKYEEGMFRLMYGEGPSGDDGEEIPDDNVKTA